MRWSPGEEEEKWFLGLGVIAQVLPRVIPPTSNRPLRGGKATLYEGGTREPCVIVWPGHVTPAQKSGAFFSSVDFFPTLVDMLRLPVQPEQKFDGVSQLPALLGRSAPRDTLFCFFPHYTPATGNVPGVWVRRGPWKLIRYFFDGPAQQDRFELFNVEHDVGELNDLSTQEPARVRELDALIEEHLRSIHAVLPVANPAFDPTAKPPAQKGKKAATPASEP